MFIFHSPNRSAQSQPAQSARALAAAMLGVLIAGACSDSTGPIIPAPSKVEAVATSPATADLYPGTTNTEFYGVQVQSEGTGLSIKFNYTGVVAPVFTIGKAADVLGSQVTSVLAKKQAGGYWTAHAGGLESGLVYYFRLDNLKSTYWASAKTLRRDVTFDIDSIYVSDDADPGPGCGEWKIRGLMEELDALQPMILFMNEKSLCSSTMYRFTGPGQEVTTFKQVEKYVGVSFDVAEEDNCFPYKTYCVETNNSWAEGVDLVKAGTTKIDQTMRKTFRPQARFWARIIVAYTAW